MSDAHDRSAARARRAEQLRRLRSVDHALVRKQGTPAAMLTREQGAVRFAYLEGYDGPAVATTLPLADEPVVMPAGAVPAFFAGLLPEGRRLSALRRTVKTSLDDELSLLLAVGGDAVGDVTVLPIDATDDDGVATVATGEAALPFGQGALSEVRFADLFTTDTGDYLDTVALPGVVDKVSDRMITFHVSRAGERRFLKLDAPEFPHLVRNEAYFIEAATRAGLPVVEAEVVTDAAGANGLLVTRFDRTVDAHGDPRSRAVEDGCQVMGLPPADKYRCSTEDVVKALAAVCVSPRAAAREFFAQVCFAYLTSNGDLHARNLAVLARDDGGFHAAPAFDLPSSYPYGDVTMALTINGRDREDITRAHLLAFAAAVDVPVRAAAAVMDGLVDRCTLWIDGLEELPFDSRTIQRWQRALRYRRDRVAAPTLIATPGRDAV